jgi:hypothetical protein
LPVGFGWWLAGITDGEANFDIHKQHRGGRDYFYCRFHIGLRADDGAILEMCQRLLGGKVYAHAKNSPSDSAGSNPQRVWELVSRQECLRLALVFKRFPLQSKKARDLATWDEALTISCGSNSAQERAEAIRPLWARLRATRVYAGPVINPSVFKEAS